MSCMDCKSSPCRCHGPTSGYERRMEETILGLRERVVSLKEEIIAEKKKQVELRNKISEQATTITNLMNEIGGNMGIITRLNECDAMEDGFKSNGSCPPCVEKCPPLDGIACSMCWLFYIKHGRGMEERDL